MSTWTKQKLGDVTEIIDCPHSTPKWTNEGVFAVRNFNLSNGRIVKGKISHVNRKTFEERTKRAVPQKGDCILSREAPIGSVGYISTDEKICLGQRVVLIHPLDNIDSRFLLYQLISASVQKQFMQSYGTGSTVSNLRIPLIKSTLISLPDKDTQNRIASVLSAYDDLIENNEKRIKILEEMAERLYREWFVKFKFPGHEKVHLIDSGTEYGKIPEGWAVKNLSEAASIVRGCSYSSEEIDDFVGDFYIVNLKSFNRGGGFRSGGAKYYSGKINKNQNLNADDIVVAVTDMTTDRAVIARPARIPEIDGDITFSADVVKINSDRLPNNFIYELLSTYKFTEKTKQMANGANVLHLKPASILEFIALIPEKNILDQFDALYRSTVTETNKLLKANNNLSEIRDLLIPQIVTGKREMK